MPTQSLGAATLRALLILAGEAHGLSRHCAEDAAHRAGADRFELCPTTLELRDRASGQRYGEWLAHELVPSAPHLAPMPLNPPQERVHRRRRTARELLDIANGVPEVQL